MRIFVTGASGFIGSHLVPALVRAGHELVCLVPPHEADRHFPHLEANPNRVQIVVESLTSGSRPLLEVMDGCTHLVHLAGLYSFFAPKNEYTLVNEIGTKNVMFAASVLRMHAVHVSTSATFGKQRGFFNEDTPPGPHASLYAKTKWHGDQHVREMRKKHRLSVSILYPACVLGAHDPQASGQYLRGVAEKPWLRGGHGIPMLPFQRREMTWVHVTDVIDAILAALQKKVARNRDYLVGGHVLPFQAINDTCRQVHDGIEIHGREYFPFDRILLLMAIIMAPFFRLFRRPPPWGFSPDQIRTMLWELRFYGSRARHELLEREYLPIESAIHDFFHT